MSERPDEAPGTPEWLADPTSPSGEQPPAAPYDPANPYGAPTPTQPLPQQGWTPYQPPASGNAPGFPAAYPGQIYPFAQPHPGANTAMGLGIASLVCAVLTFVVCVTLPGVLCGPFAIALAVKAQREIKASPGTYNNAGAATTGLVTGIIGTVVGVAMIGIVVFFAGLILNGV